jgi:hypothetical protein
MTTVQQQRNQHETEFTSLKCLRVLTRNHDTVTTMALTETKACKYQLLWCRFESRGFADDIWKIANTILAMKPKVNETSSKGTLFTVPYFGFILG